MKRVALVTAFPPCRYNLGPPQAFIYQYLKHRPRDMDVDLFYYTRFVPGQHESLYQADFRDLGLGQVRRLANTPSLPRRVMRRLAGYRTFLRQVYQVPIEERVVRSLAAYDAVWLYPLWLIDWARQARAKRLIVTGPDSLTLHFERRLRLGGWRTAGEGQEIALQLRQAENLEKAWAETEARVHFVGMNDVVSYEQATARARPGQAYFTPYPLHDHATIRTAITDTPGPVSVLISGGAGTVYVGGLLERVMEVLAERAAELRGAFTFTFLGKRYESPEQLLGGRGYSVRRVEWVDDIREELSRHQVQIFPIVVGSGTKGKVLEAMATGLLSVGTGLAFENIEATPGRDCILFREAEEIPRILREIAADRAVHAAIAASGMRRVREEHAAGKCSDMFWERFGC